MSYISSPNSQLQQTSCNYTGTGNNPFIGNPDCKVCDGIGYIKGYDNKVCPNCEKYYKKNVCLKCNDTGMIEEGKKCLNCNKNTLNNCEKCKGTGMTVGGKKCDCDPNLDKLNSMLGNCDYCKGQGTILGGEKCNHCIGNVKVRDINCKKCKGTGMNEKGKPCKRCLL
jgi:hypothetical protein